MPVMLRPSNVIVPDVGATSHVSILKNVVLPAPYGERGTARRAHLGVPGVAVRHGNVAFAAAPAPQKMQEIAQPADDPVAQEHDQHDEDQPEDELPFRAELQRSLQKVLQE